MDDLALAPAPVTLALKKPHIFDPMVDLVLEYKGRKVNVQGLFDTGASDTMVPPQIAEKLGFDLNKLEAATRFHGVKGRHTTFPIIFDRMTFKEIPGCSVGPVFARTSRVSPMDYLLIGRPLMQAAGMKIAFDRAKHAFRITCTRPDVSVRRMTSGARLVDERESIVREAVLRHGNIELQGPVILDTGATGTLLPLWLAKQLGMQPKPLFVRGHGAVQSFTILAGRLDEIEIVGTSCRGGPYPAMITPHANYVLVGVDFFLDAGLTIDFSGKDTRIYCGK